MIHPHSFKGSGPFL